MKRLALSEQPALARTGDWWRGLTRRERAMVGGLIALLALLLLVFGIVKPLQAARADAKGDIRTYETLMARMRAAGTLVAAPAPVPAGPPGTIVSQAASSAGIEVTVADADGTVRATGSGIAYAGVVNWLAYATRAGLSVTNASIEKGDAPGLVNVEVEFAR